MDTYFSSIPLPSPLHPHHPYFPSPTDSNQQLLDLRGSSEDLQRDVSHQPFDSARPQSLNGWSVQLSSSLAQQDFFSNNQQPRSRGFNSSTVAAAAEQSHPSPYSVVHQSTTDGAIDFHQQTHGLLLSQASPQTQKLQDSQTMTANIYPQQQQQQQQVFMVNNQRTPPLLNHRNSSSNFEQPSNPKRKNSIQQSNPSNLSRQTNQTTEKSASHRYCDNNNNNNNNMCFPHRSFCVTYSTANHKQKTQINQ
eukprot:GDKK01048137.1.p1 GENE.GDKK01048137.1~~GDKK01048137.1.p1  ORF type:complete len:250 (-),score=64.65 GDKK01048137.1:324-1073(-)